MTFREQYLELEREFKEQVKRDSKDLGISSSYVPNFIPQGPVCRLSAKMGHLRGGGG